MDRSSISRRTVIAVVVASMLLALLAVVSNPLSAGADPILPTTISTENYQVAASGSPLTVAVTLNPGSTRIGAVAGALTFDTNQLGFVSCASTGMGVCNFIDGQVRFAAVDVASWTSPVDVLTVEFDTSNVVSGSALTITVDDIYDSDVLRVDDREVANGSVTIGVAAEEGAITGHVSNATSGFGLVGAEVCASDQTQVAACGLTNAWGEYEIEGLASGTYGVSFVDTTGLLATLTTEGVVVTSPDVTPDIDASLAPARSTSAEEDVETDQPESQPEDTVDDSPSGVHGTLAGTVTNLAGSPVFGAEVCAVQPLVMQASCVFTKPDGSYTLAELPTGNYNLTATDPARRYGDAESQFMGVSRDSLRIVDISLPAR